VDFEENNGSQAEQVVPSDVGDGDSSQVIKAMGIGHILPCETHQDQDQDQANDEEESYSTQVIPSIIQVEPSIAPQVEPVTQEETHTEEKAPSSQPLEQDQEVEQEPSTSQGQAQDQEEAHDQEPSKEVFVGHDGMVRRVKAATKDSGLNVDKILGSISKGVVTRRQIALLTLFFKHHSFVSCFEPLKVHEALLDLDWVIAMQEELECFTCNKVWYLVERPKD
jgi:hypothetical protein